MNSPAINKKEFVDEIEPSNYQNSAIIISSIRHMHQYPIPNITEKEMTLQLIIMQRLVVRPSHPNIRDLYWSKPDKSKALVPTINNQYLYEKIKWRVSSLYNSKISTSQKKITHNIHKSILRLTFFRFISYCFIILLLLLFDFIQWLHYHNTPWIQKWFKI